MNHFYYILYDLVTRKVIPIKRQKCYIISDKNVINAFNTLLDIM